MRMNPMAITNKIVVAAAKSEVGARVLAAKYKTVYPDYTFVIDDENLWQILAAARTETGENCVAVNLDSAAAYQRLRRVWNEMPPEIRPDVSVRLIGENDYVRPEIWLIADELAPSTSIQNCITNLSKNGPIFITTANAPINWCDDVVAMTLSSNPFVSIMRDLDNVKITSESQIVFFRQPTFDRIPRAYWKSLFVRAMPKLMVSSGSGSFKPLRFFSDCDADTLFIFPERMLPLSRAYYQRAMDVLLGLAYRGRRTATLVLGPGNDDLDRIRRTLEIFSPTVTTHPLVRGEFSKKHKALRKLERYYRNSQGIMTNATLRYSERRVIFGTNLNGAHVCNVLMDNPSIESVVYTGAWFGPSVAKAQKRFPALNWYCDTHDVFHVVDHDTTGKDKRLFYSAQKEKSREVRDLGRADGVIAISPSDHESLKNAGVRSNVITESGSFSHAVSPFQTMGEVAPRSFGFVGTKNLNNIKCLATIKNDWWPEILAHWPDARLSLIGSICETDIAKQFLASHNDSVVPCGFVDALEDVYAATAFMLSPIAVQGGLNFKSVEALMAGCFLLTNEMGSRCLGPMASGVYIINEDCKNISAILDSISEVTDMNEKRSEIKSYANDQYGDDVAYASLVELMDERGQEVPKKELK